MDVEDPYSAGRRQSASMDGIQLNVMGSAGSGSGGGYNSLPADSAHGRSSDTIEGSSNTEEDSFYRDSSRNREHPHSSSGKYSALPTLISGINAYLPTSWTGAHPGKLERVGSDEPLNRATNPLSHPNTPDKAAAGAGKGYFPHNTTSTVKLRSSVTTSNTTAHSGSTSSVHLPSSSGVSAGATTAATNNRTIRTSSADSAEYI